MSNTVKEVLDAALSLDVCDRADVAVQLIESLDEADDMDQIALDAAWQKEIEQRLAEVDRGEAELIPAEEVFRSLRKQNQK